MSGGFGRLRRIFCRPGDVVRALGRLLRGLSLGNRCLVGRSFGNGSFLGRSLFGCRSLLGCLSFLCGSFDRRGLLGNLLDDLLSLGGRRLGGTLDLGSNDGLGLLLRCRGGFCFAGGALLGALLGLLARLRLVRIVAC